MGLFDAITAPISQAVQSVGNTAASTVNYLGQATGANGGVNNPLGTLLNIATNYATGGLAGYNAGQNSGTEGIFTHAADEGLGAVTGRNTARDALAAQSSAVAADAAQADQDLKDTQAANERADITASQAAKSNQNQASAASQAALGGYMSGSSSDERNFLGL